MNLHDKIGRSLALDGLKRALVKGEFQVMRRACRCPAQRSAGKGGRGFGLLLEDVLDGQASPLAGQRTSS